METGFLDVFLSPFEPQAAPCPPGHGPPKAGGSVGGGAVSVPPLLPWRVIPSHPAPHVQPFRPSLAWGSLAPNILDSAG